MKPLSILTCVLIIAPAAALVLKGVDLLRFERFEAAMQTLVERAADRNSDCAAMRQELNAMIREAEDWSSTPGLEARARQALGLLEQAKGPAKSSRPWWTAAVSPEPADAHLARLESIMTGLLAVRPTDGLHWVELAKLRLARNAPLPEALSALEMSLVTERLERATMSARAPVLLALWENLPDDMKRVAIRQFIDLNGNFEPNAFREFKAILSAKSAQTRETLKEKIATQGAGARPWMEKAGF